MALRNILINNQLQQTLRSSSPLILTSRHGHTVRGKPPGVAKTIEQRLQGQ